MAHYFADDHARSYGEIDPSGAYHEHRADDCRSAGRKVLLDADLALLFGVPTKRLNEQVRRNANRFPADFMFRLTDHKVTALRSQTATSKPRRGGRRYLPYAFTEHGAIMAATILNTPRAIEVSVYHESKIERKLANISRCARSSED